MHVQTTFLSLILASLILTACMGTNYKPAHQYRPGECKHLYSRGLINLEQKNLCLKGQAFTN